MGLFKFLAFSFSNVVLLYLNILMPIYDLKLVHCVLRSVLCQAVL